MKQFKLINTQTNEPPVIVQTDEEVPRIGIWDKFKAYELVETNYPLPKCLPQRVSLNEMEVGDIIKHDINSNNYIKREI